VDVDAAVPGAAALLPSCVQGARTVGPWSCLVNERLWQRSDYAARWHGRACFDQTPMLRKIVLHRRSCWPAT